MITSKNYNVEHANFMDKKLMYDVAKKIIFEEKALGNKRTRDKSRKRLLKSRSIMPGSLKRSKPKSCSLRFFFQS